MVIFLLRSSSIKSLLLYGSNIAISNDPSLYLATSDDNGFPTFKIISAEEDSSEIDAPTSLYKSSPKLDLTPADGSIITSWPMLMNFFTESGVAATLFSLFISLGIKIFICK